MNKTDPVFWTEDRKLYEKGLKYLQTEGVIKKSRDAWQFFNDRQWEGLERSEIFGKDGPPFINFIKPDVLYKLSTVGKKNVRIVFLPSDNTLDSFMPTAERVCEQLSAYGCAVWEKAKLDSLRWRALRDAIVVGDGLVHFAGHREKANSSDENGEVTPAPEILDTVNVLYSDENEMDIQKQDYILISFRRPVSELRREALENGLSETEVSCIVADAETEGQANDAADKELDASGLEDGKALVILKYWRGDDGLILMRKSASNCVIMPDTETGLSNFPIAKFSWEEVKNSARGNGIVNAQIPNQIEYNKTLARRVVKVMEGAYPKLVYNENVIDNPDDLDNVGAKIAVRGQEPITNYVGFLPATQMSSDVLALSNDLMKLTQEMSGASEAALGKVNPEQASGRAILAVQDASAQIMSLQMQQHEQFIEDIARILLDFWTAYTDEGGMKLRYRDVNGNSVSDVIPRDVIENLRVNIKIEVSPSSPYSIAAVEQTLENYMRAKYITFEELVEALPDNAVAPKNILKRILKQRETAQQKQAAQGAPVAAGENAGIGAVLEKLKAGASGAMPAGMPAGMQVMAMPNGGGMPMNPGAGANLGNEIAARVRKAVAQGKGQKMKK